MRASQTALRPDMFSSADNRIVLYTGGDCQEKFKNIFTFFTIGILDKIRVINSKSVIILHGQLVILKLI